MNIDTTGIKNENEYYYEHYFSSMLGEGLKPVFDSWSEQEKAEKKPPNKLFESFRQDFLKARARVEKTRNMSRILEDWRPSLKKIIEILGYEYSPSVLVLSNNEQIPIVGRVNRSDGSSEVILIEALATEAEYMDGLKCSFLGEQFPEDFEEINIPEKNIEDLVSLALFDGENPPRWVLIFAKNEIILIDRSKWSEKRLMRFDLDEIMGRKEPSTIKATVALLHKDQLVPKDGVCLLDSLDENSHKHAHGVSEDLKYSLREAIELIGQEAVDYIKRVRKEKIYEREDDIAEQLSLECLRYMYRLLFLFYIESRPELGYAPMNSETYRKGYSLEALRDLELTRLTTPEAQDGFTIHEWIERLFSLVYNGEGWESETLGMLEEGSRYHTFTMPPLKAHLFDPERTPILSKVKFRNKVLQKVIELMSLSRERERGSQKRGRVSYSELGINQLGAVYEALLSFRGFFAEEELYEVKKADTNPDPLEPAYFVTESDLSKYDEEEKVFNSDGTYKIYEKGTFIYRLSGRDREKSASYYTPEVLTQCLVKYSLKELLKEKTADDILKITVCEPAMGSAAFLNEAVNQLAEAYLIKKQKELGQNIPHDEYVKEKQKVKMYLADNNVFGVDLNPVAVELAEVSLWLNTIHEGGFVPWFGMQLVSGNSLVGARREVYDVSSLREKPSGGQGWLNEVPKRINNEQEKTHESIYHFITPSKGMANYNDKLLKKLMPDKFDKIDSWKIDFMKPFSDEEITHLRKLSAEIDKLWTWHENKLQQVREQTTDYIEFFGRSSANAKSYSEKPTSTFFKDRVYEDVVLSKDTWSASPFRRLKLVMDYWCALWFWPIQEASLLPTRSEYLMEISVILLGNIFETSDEADYGKPMFSDFLSKEEVAEIADKFGVINLNKLKSRFPRLALVEKIAKKHRFLHWELEFADVFRSARGFSLILGNPPWRRLEWRENDVLGDVDPVTSLKKTSSKVLNQVRDLCLNNQAYKLLYLDEYEEISASQSYFGAESNFPILRGISVNLFKVFLPKSWSMCNQSGLTSFLHPEGVFDDPKGGVLREEIYSRIKYHFQFQNESRLFPQIAPVSVFSINIYGNKNGDVAFDAISNCYHPKTVDDCYEKSDSGKVPGIKNEENKLELAGHPDRVLKVTKDDLRIYASVFDESGTSAMEARLPRVHSVFAQSIIKKINEYPTRLESFKDSYVPSVMFIEKEALKKKFFKQQTCFPDTVESLVLNGPHMHVANPYFKTPKRVCKQKEHYSVVDHELMPESYLPRTNYVPNYQGELKSSIPSIGRGSEPITSFHSAIFRKMINSTWERTLVGCLKPPRVLHVDSIFSLTFLDETDAVYFSGLCSSLVFDFLIKTTGKTNFRNDLASMLPFSKERVGEIVCRTLILNCLTSHFSDIWSKSFSETFKGESWGKNDKRLDRNFFKKLEKRWSPNFALRNDYSRRQALIEIDVLTAMMLGISLEELIEIYRQIFYGLKNVEKNTFYDQQGKIVFIKRKGFESVGLPKKTKKGEIVGFEDVKSMTEGVVVHEVEDDTNPGEKTIRTITYVAPFDRCDREEDYRTTWAEFERRFSAKEMIK